MTKLYINIKALILIRKLTIKKIVFVLLFFQLVSISAQNTLKQIINKTPIYESYYSPFSYYDKAGKKQGFSIQNETQILKKLKLESPEHFEYFITGKYEINDLTVLFISKYWVSEDIHFAILLDKSLNIIDKLEETAYSNDEGFYEVKSSVDYNIITTTVHNIYSVPKYVEKKHTITNKGFKEIKDQVIIRTPSGIRIRKKPTTKSLAVTSAPNLSVFNYLSREYPIDSTSVFDNGKYLKNYWLKIAQKDSLKLFGYVFGAFAKRSIKLNTNEYKVVVNEVSKAEFHSAEIKKINNSTVVKITDIKKIKSILKNHLIGNFNEDGLYNLKKIVADNGKEIKKYLDECSIMSYYPKYNYLLLECRHASDYLINLKNGKDDVNRIGNPDYYIPSPRNTFRLNGYYSGQSSIHFLEKNNINNSPEYLLDISSLISLDYIEKCFWVNDNTFFLKSEKMFYKIHLQKN